MMLWQLRAQPKKIRKVSTLSISASLSCGIADTATCGCLVVTVSDKVAGIESDVGTTVFIFVVDIILLTESSESCSATLRTSCDLKNKPPT